MAERMGAVPMAAAMGEVPDSCSRSRIAAVAAEAAWKAAAAGSKPAAKRGESRESRAGDDNCTSGAPPPLLLAGRTNGAAVGEKLEDRARPDTDEGAPAPAPLCIPMAGWPQPLPMDVVPELVDHAPPPTEAALLAPSVAPLCVNGNDDDRPPTTEGDNAWGDTESGH